MPRSTSTQFITTRRLYIYLSFHARSRAARAQSCNVILATARRSGKVWDGWIRPGIPCTCRVLRGVTCIKGGTALPSLRTRRKGTTDRDSELADNFNVKVTRLMSFYYLVAPFSLIFLAFFPRRDRVNAFMSVGLLSACQVSIMLCYSAFQGPMQLRTCSLQTLLRDAAPLGSITVSIDAKVYGVRKCVLNMREHFRSLVGSRYVVSKIYV